MASGWSAPQSCTPLQSTSCAKGFEEYQLVFINRAAEECSTEEARSSARPRGVGTSDLSGAAAEREPFSRGPPPVASKGARQEQLSLAEGRRCAEPGLRQTLR